MTWQTSILMIYFSQNQYYVSRLYSLMFMDCMPSWQRLPTPLCYIRYNQDHQQRIRDHHWMNKVFRNSHHEHDLVVIQPDSHHGFLMTTPQEANEAHIVKRQTPINRKKSQTASSRFHYHFAHPDFAGVFRRWFLFENPAKHLAFQLHFRETWATTLES